MKRLLLLAVFVVGACNVGPTEVDENGYYHDEAHGVSCWVIRTGYGAGISCIPDSELKP